MLKSKYERMPPKIITYRSHKRKVAVRSDSCYIEGENLVSLQNVKEKKRLEQFALLKDIVLRGNDKLHTAPQIRKAILKRPKP